MSWPSLLSIWAACSWWTDTSHTAVSLWHIWAQDKNKREDGHNHGIYGCTYMVHNRFQYTHMGFKSKRLLTLRWCEMGLVSGEIFGHNRSRCFWLFFIEVEEYSEFFSRSIHKFMESWIWAGNFSNPTGTSVVTTWNMIFSVVWCLMSLWLTFRVKFLMKKRTNIVVNDGGVHPLARTLLSLVSNLWWNIVMKDWDSDEKSLGKSQ